MKIDKMLSTENQNGTAAVFSHAVCSQCDLGYDIFAYVGCFRVFEWVIYLYEGCSKIT